MQHWDQWGDQVDDYTDEEEQGRDWEVELLLELVAEKGQRETQEDEKVDYWRKPLGHF